MPAEVLSYFLKNSDQKLRLKFQIVLQCAPFLKGLKISSVITVESILYEELEEIFREMDISYRKLCSMEEKSLILFFRAKELQEYLIRPDIRSLLEAFGYHSKDLEPCLSRLSERVCVFSERGMGFPHEIGVFLGYPAEDVSGFIENEGQRYRMSGYWKVYGDISEAQTTFNAYDRAKDHAVNEFLIGKSIQEIAQ
jgi:hypothetical protein